MIGYDIAVALNKLRNDRTDKQRELMREYDETFYYPERKKLIDQCPHEDSNNWQNNGIGWMWTNCKWCGKEMRSESYWRDKDAGSDETV